MNTRLLHARLASPNASQHGSYGRVLVFDSRSEVRHLATLLQREGGCTVRFVSTLSEALSAMVMDEWEMLIIDPAIAAEHGRSLIFQAQSVLSGVVVALFTEEGNSTDAETQGDGVVVLPLGASDLESVVMATRLITTAQHSRMVNPEIVLAIGAHPDDVEIGVGGSLLAHRAAGHAVNVLTLSKGARGGETEIRESEARAAAAMLGVRLFLEDLEDTKIPDGHPTVELIEHVIQVVRPTTIYTHSSNDTHQDHRAVHRATLVAARSVGRVACYQSPSATIDFRPNRFVPIDLHLGHKQAAIAAYESQTEKCAYLSPDVISTTTRYWARFAKCEHAEALEVVRDATTFDTHTIADSSSAQTRRHHHAAR